MWYYLSLSGKDDKKGKNPLWDICELGRHLFSSRSNIGYINRKISSAKDGNGYSPRYSGTYTDKIYFVGAFTKSYNCYVSWQKDEKGYNLIISNCIQAACRALYEGSFSYYSSLYKEMFSFAMTGVIPNTTFAKIRGCVDAIPEYYKLPKWKKIVRCSLGLDPISMYFR